MGRSDIKPQGFKVTGVRDQHFSNYMTENFEEGDASEASSQQIESEISESQDMFNKSRDSSFRVTTSNNASLLGKTKSMIFDKFGVK